jgi:hypothetical protein
LFRIGKNDGMLLKRWRNFGFQKILGISGLAEDLVGSQLTHYSMVSVLVAACDVAKCKTIRHVVNMVLNFIE